MIHVYIFDPKHPDRKMFQEVQIKNTKICAVLLDNCKNCDGVVGLSKTSSRVTVNFKVVLSKLTVVLVLKIYNHNQWRLIPQSNLPN